MKTFKMFAIAMVALSLGSCEKDNLEETNALTPENTNTVLKNFEGTMINVQDLGDGTYELGDIKFAENQFSSEDYSPDPFAAPGELEAKLNQGRGVRKWEDNTVVYTIESNFSSTLRSELQAAMDEWSSKTSIRFKERTNETEYVRIISNGRSCNCGSAYLGVVNFNGFIGTIELGSGSSKSVITHEIGHTLGYTHEQNRVDRDQFINVLYENIQEGGRDQYFVATGSSTLTSTLDYNSIMMYSSRTFGNGNGPTMTRIDNGEAVQGFGNTLTALDIVGTNNAYPPIDVQEPTPVDVCDGVAEYRYQRYFIGDLVTYRGFLYRRDRTRWTQLGACGS